MTSKIEENSLKKYLEMGKIINLQLFSKKGVFWGKGGGWFINIIVFQYLNLNSFIEYTLENEPLLK